MMEAAGASDFDEVDQEMQTSSTSKSSTTDHNRYRDSFPKSKQMSSRGQAPDVEKGAPRISKVKYYPSGYPRSAAFLDYGENIMVYRRFGSLHRQLLLQKQDELTQLEQMLLELDKEEHNNQPIKLSSRRKLAEYDSVLLRMESLSQVPKPKVGRYQTVREYLRHGPLILLEDSEAMDPCWKDYQRDIAKLLNDPSSSIWLNGPLDDLLIGSSSRRWLFRENPDRLWYQHWYQRVEGGGETIISSVFILFWILHITSALAFLLIANSSDPNAYNMAKNLFMYWYASATSIVVHGFKCKGDFLYARKVILGGVLACGGGFDILTNRMGISNGPAITALPVFFTITLLLIRNI